MTEDEWRDAGVLWDYHHLRHELRACAAGIGLGSHDPGVAAEAARLYHAGLVPVLVFSGATTPTTYGRFPRGEAVHYREHARSLGVPESAILVEPTAVNTGQNIDRSRALLERAGITAGPVLLISKPYMERRAYATCRQVWPGAEPVCASEPASLADYARRIGDPRLITDMMVGDVQRILEYPRRGFAISQPVPDSVLGAWRRLIRAGFTSRLLAPP
ncbi:MAG TPA: YdcF family protein [Streptosporangiaceae bacterium]|jgi:uncharacterized SAM-binding protein YcdF (DUF218 family)